MRVRDTYDCFGTFLFFIFSYTDAKETHWVRESGQPFSCVGMVMPYRRDAITVGTLADKEGHIDCGKYPSVIRRMMECIADAAKLGIFYLDLNSANILILSGDKPVGDVVLNSCPIVIIDYGAVVCIPVVPQQLCTKMNTIAGAVVDWNRIVECHSHHGLELLGEFIGINVHSLDGFPVNRYPYVPRNETSAKKACPEDGLASCRIMQWAGRLLYRTASTVRYVCIHVHIFIASNLHILRHRAYNPARDGTPLQYIETVLTPYLAELERRLIVK